jgi:cobalt/nickel transport system permease protein
VSRVRGKSAQIALFVYVAAAFAASAVTDWRVSAVLLAVLLAVFFRDAAFVLRRTLLLVAPFVAVTAAAAAGYWWSVEGTLDRMETVPAFALRAILLACMTFVFIRRVDLFEALAFSKTLRTVLTMTVAQIQIHRRVVGEFAQALRSRTITRPGTGRSLEAAAVVSGSLLRQSLSQGRETAEAMRSRGI